MSTALASEQMENDLSQLSSEAAGFLASDHKMLDLAVPFGGVKGSGIGRELGGEAIRHHTDLKTVTMAL